MQGITFPLTPTFPFRMTLLLSQQPAFHFAHSSSRIIGNIPILMQVICLTLLRRFPFLLSVMWFWSRGLHAWNLWRGSGSSTKVSMTCLLSCSEERLTVEGKHLELKELLMKGRCGKKERHSICLKPKAGQGPIKITL